MKITDEMVIAACKARNKSLFSCVTDSNSAEENAMRAALEAAFACNTKSLTCTHNRTSCDECGFTISRADEYAREVGIWPAVPSREEIEALRRTGRSSRESREWNRCLNRVLTLYYGKSSTVNAAYSAKPVPETIVEQYPDLLERADRADAALARVTEMCRFAREQNMVLTPQEVEASLQGA
jgi:hypothetical protein